MEGKIKNDDLLDYQSGFPGTSILLPQLCTASDGRRCHILDQLPACNKLLNVVRTRLEEKPRDRLSLVSEWYSGELTASEAERRQASTLIFCFITKHRCLDTVSLSICQRSEALQEHQKVILDFLRAAPALTKLHLVVIEQSIGLMKALPCISYLTLLQTLECSITDCPEVASGLGPLLKTSTSLTTLTLDLLRPNDSFGHELWAALATCKRLNSLKVRFSYTLSATKGDHMDFLKYLEQASSLTRVCVALHYKTTSRWLTYVLEALNGHDGLVNVTCTGFIVNFEEALTIKDFLSANSGIRSFALKHCFFCNDEGGAPRYDTDDFGTLTPLILPWLSILKTNCMLRKLRLNFRGFSPAECAAFMEELSRNHSLKNVAIEDFGQYYLSLGRRRLLSNIGKELGRQLDRGPEILHAQCEQIRRVRLDVRKSEHLEWFLTAARSLQLSRLVIDFNLDLRWFHLTQDSALAVVQFIEASKTLEALRVFFRLRDDDPKTSSMLDIQRIILRAVRRNSSIKDLFLWYAECTGPDAEELAYEIGESKTICYLNLYFCDKAMNLFLSRIFPTISRSYMLVSAYIRNISKSSESRYQDLLNVIARNQGLVQRAAKFVAGSGDVTCAEAIEYVSSSAELVKQVRELASVDETEASRMISEKIKGFQDMDAFMRFSGVVHRRASCHMKCTGEFQLDDVDEYSWCCIRKYLRLADVQK